MRRKTKAGPWGNPRLKEARYQATIKAIRFCEIENGKKAILELTFKLQETPKPFITRIYLVRNAMTQAKQRLWHLCQAIGCEAYDLIEETEGVIGKKLQLEIATEYPSYANQGQPYSDVRRFLPSCEVATTTRECGKE